MAMGETDKTNGRNFIREWPKFANGKPYPYIAWGRTFREPVKDLTQDSTWAGVSIIAAGLRDKGEIALVQFGIVPPPEKLLAEFGEMPEWHETFEEFEDFKFNVRQDNAGLLVIAHGNNGHGPEAASFGATTPELAAHDLSIISKRLLSQSGIQQPVETQGIQTAA
jgi:hypothetical protein